MTRLTRADLDALPNYVPGRNVADLARELGIAEAIKLASNEVPYGPLPGVVEAVTEAARSVHRYPDMGVIRLRDAIGERFGVDPERVVTGCGSVALAEILAKATCLPGDEIVYSWRSFEAYPIIAAGGGATSVRVPNTAAHGHDLAAMAEAITDQTRMVFVCNPNNPTGTSVRKTEIDRFLADVPSDVLVVLDEAYREFVTDPDVPDGLETYGDRPNVVVLRTMSKAWGLAGLRMGYLVAQPEVASAVRKVVTPSPPAQSRRQPRWPRWSRRTRYAAAAPWSSPSGPGSPRPCASSPSRFRRARPTSSGCRSATGPPTSPPPARTGV